VYCKALAATAACRYPPQRTSTNARYGRGRSPVAPGTDHALAEAACNRRRHPSQGFADLLSRCARHDSATRHCRDIPSSSTHMPHLSQGPRLTTGLGTHMPHVSRPDAPQMPDYLIKHINWDSAGSNNGRRRLTRAICMPKPHREPSRTSHMRHIRAHKAMSIQAAISHSQHICPKVV
jgi:hypothetical protein